MREALDLHSQITHLVSQRDELRAQIERVRALHKPYSIYEECDHDHEPDEPDVVQVEDIGYTCAKLYDICNVCCRDDGRWDGQSEGCAEGHEHGPDLPYCKTIEALRSPAA